MKILSSYKELKELFEINNYLEIIPANKMDYHPFLKEGYYGFNDKTPRNFIFSVENVDDKNCAIDCYVIGLYDFNKKERFGFRCGKSVSCTWYLTVGEKYYYNINHYPDEEKYVPFIMESVNLMPFFNDIKKASKDDERRINKENRIAKKITASYKKYVANLGYSWNNKEDSE